MKSRWLYRTEVEEFNGGTICAKPDGWPAPHEPLRRKTRNHVSKGVLDTHAFIQRNIKAPFYEPKP